MYKKSLKISPMPIRIVSKFWILLIIGCYLVPVGTYASWYAGGSVLLHPFPYHPLHTNYIKLGSSQLNDLANGISINAGYKFCLHRFALASEFDMGSFSDADGNITHKDVLHYVSASYYMALKEKLGFYIRRNLMIYALIGLSQNSIGDRIYSTVEYFNKKQLSVLSGAGLEYYTKRDNKLALFAEWFYFAPTNMTLYSGGAKPSPDYSLSAGGGVLQFGMRYYFDCKD